VPTAPYAKGLDISRFSVSQLVSFAFYLITFLHVIRNYDARTAGLGRLLPKDVFQNLPSDFASFFPYVILGAVIILNAIRYYWSFWLVELDTDFAAVRRDDMKPFVQMIEWSLRSGGLICLYVLQIALRRVELLLILLYASLVIWDYVVRGHVSKVYYPELWKKVNFWCHVELAGLFASVGYVFAAMAFAGRVLYLSLAIGGLAVVFVVLFVLELHRHRADYWNRGFLVVFLVICAASALFTELVER